jgi:hypothetical protein
LSLGIGAAAGQTDLSERFCQTPRRVVVDVDSFVGEVYGYGEQGAGLGLHTQAWVSPDRGDPLRDQ